MNTIADLNSDARVHIFAESEPAPSTTPLQEALALFNEAFGYDLRTPIIAEHVETAAELAALRGRQDIATELRTALALTITADRAR